MPRVTRTIRPAAAAALALCLLGAPGPAVVAGPAAVAQTAERAETAEPRSAGGAVAAGEGRGPVVLLTLDGAVQPASLRYLRRGLEEAAERRAEAVILRLDTPGGLVTSLRDMTSAIIESKVPVVVWVAPPGARAASAGFFLLLAADVAAMAPGTNTGAAHPVPIGQREDADETAATKAANDVAAFARALAAQRGRPVELAEEAVLDSRSFAVEEAAREGLIDVVAADLPALLGLLDGRVVTRVGGELDRLDVAGARVVAIEPTWAERLLMVIADPSVAFLLLTIGMLGILAEILSPGAVVPGVLGGICLLLALYALSVVPVNWVGALLLAAALGLFVAEALVTSYGLLALAGLICFVLGAMMLVESPVPGVASIGLGLVLPTAVLFALVIVFLMTRVVRARRAPAVTGLEALVGEVGTAMSPLEPEGLVFVHGEYWHAISSPGPVPSGARVRVVRVEGRTLGVAPVEEVPA